MEFLCKANRAAFTVCCRFFYLLHTVRPLKSLLYCR